MPFISASELRKSPLNFAMSPLQSRLKFELNFSFSGNFLSSILLSAATLNLPSFKAIVAAMLELLLKIFCPFACTFTLAFASLSLPLSAKISPSCASFRLRSRFSFFMAAFSLPAKASPPKFSSFIFLSFTFTSPASAIFEPTSKPLTALNFSGSLMSRANLLKIWLFFRS